ncbi:UNVERIFIED_CONTAM: hypothetical protein HDU68_002317 [Siphonaria sp. JEL0065]|nr:hypothetical protein HDU68_002317 [Siphonaria sp. JEL0065]
MSTVPPTASELKDNIKITWKELKLIKGQEPEEPKAWKGSSYNASSVLLLCLLILPAGVLIMMFVGSSAGGFNSIWNAADCGLLVLFNIFKFFAVQRAAPGWITAFIYIHFANCILFCGLNIGSFVESQAHGSISPFFYALLALEDVWVIGFTYTMIQLALKLRNHAVDVRRLVRAAEAAKAITDAAAAGDKVAAKAAKTAAASASTTVVIPE